MMLVRIEDHIRAFQRAHQAVLSQLGGADRIVNRDDCFLLLKTTWAQQHRARIPGPPRAWTHMQFDSAADFTRFLLQWS